MHDAAADLLADTSHPETSHPETAHPDTHHPDPIEELFDEPNRWRAQAARSLGLRDDDLLAAVSPGVACPMVLRSLATGIATAGEVDVLVDVGAGAGGISEWLRRRTGAAVVAIEPAEGARQTATSLFPAVSVRPGTAEATGLADHVADAAVLCGVVSLIADLGPVLDEMERIVRPGGSLAIADLFASTLQPVLSGPNRFHGVEQLTAALAVRGWSIEVIGCGAPTAEARWADAVARVDRWIRTHRSTHPSYASWAADQHHLADHVERGDLVAACLVARR